MQQADRRRNRGLHRDSMTSLAEFYLLTKMRTERFPVNLGSWSRHLASQKLVPKVLCLI